MNDHHLPPPLPINLRTATHILQQTFSLFTSHSLSFLFVSLLLFTFRYNVENGSHYLTFFIDRDPSLKSLLSRVEVSSSSPSAAGSPHLRHRRRRPFLQLTRVGTLDDDFFSGDEDIDRSLFRSLPKLQPNASFLILGNFDSNLGFSDFVSDNGIRVSEIVRTGVSFKVREKIHVQQEENEGSENESAIDFRFLFRGFERGHRDLMSLFFLVGFLSVSYGCVILGFLATYAWVLGIVFVIVVNDLLNKYKSFFRTVWDGSNLGLKRLSGFILMRWAVRDSLTQLLGIWFFGEIDDQYSFFKIFVRLKLMPFSIMSSRVKGFEREITGFLTTWFLLDTLLGFMFAVDAWIAMVDSRKSGREVVKEGCHLLSLMLYQAIHIKCLEGIICGSLTRWFISMFLGKLFASVFQSVMEVYFMVAWLMYYFSVKSKDAYSIGEPFDSRELEGFLEGAR